MFRIIQCPLSYDDDLVETIRIYNKAVQNVMDEKREVNEFFSRKK